MVPAVAPLLVMAALVLGDGQGVDCKIANAVTKQFVYWYNPESKKYWARCPTVHHPKYGKQVKEGKDLWSYIPAAKRKMKLEEIPEILEDCFARLHRIEGELHRMRPASEPAT